jgi:transcriptional regulator with XRE-family HTH domain
MPRTSSKPSDITGYQARVAREMLALTREQLSERSKIPVRTLSRFEDGRGPAMPNTVVAIRVALEAAGVEFIAENGGGAGVRLRDPRRD